MTGPADPERFELARRRAELTVQQLWIRYLALGGSGDVFDLEAFLQGLAPIAALQHDILAHALNERLKEIYDETQVPYLSPGLNPTGDESSRAESARAESSLAESSGSLPSKSQTSGPESPDRSSKNLERAVAELLQAYDATPEDASEGRDSPGNDRTDEPNPPAN